MRGKRFTPSQNAISGDVEVSGNLTISGDVVVGGNISVSGSGEANTASNLGSGEGTFVSKVGVDLRFKSLVPQGTVGITSDGNQIYISASSPPFNHASQHEDGGDDEIVVDDLIGELADPQKVMVRQNSGTNIGAQPRLNFIEGDNITISITEDVVNNEIDIEISGSAGGGSGDITNAENTGSGQGVFLEKSGTNLIFRSLSGSGGTVVSSGSNGVIIISSSVEGGGSGESNTASNVGGGTGLFAQKDGVDLEFKSLLVSGNLSIDSNSAEISLSSSYATGENVGGAVEIFSGSSLGNMDFRTISGSGGVTVSQTDDLIVISSSLPVIPDPGEDNTASNIGGGTGLFAQKDGVDLEFKSLNVSGNLSIVSNASEINLSSSYATGESVGSGVEIFSGSVNGNFDFRTLSGSGGTSVSQNGDLVVISSSIPVIPDPGEDNTASNVGTGEGLFAQKDGVDLEFKSLNVSGNLSITSNASEVNISSSYATGENTGSGQGVFLESVNGNLLFRTLIGEGGTNISSGSNGVIVVSSALGGGSGEVNTAINIGSGEGLFSGKDGVTINLRSLVGSGSTSILSGSDVVAISSSYATGENVGSGEGVFSGSSLGNLDFKSLSGSGGVSVFQDGANTIVISSSIPVIPDPGEDNTASNVGGGTGLFAQKDGVDLEFKSLLVSGNLAIVSNASEVSFSSSYATGENTGSGQGVFLESVNGNLLFRSIIGDGGTNISSGSNGVIVVSSALGGGSGEVNTAANIGSGEGLFSGKDGITISLRSLVSSGSTSILSGSDVIAISSSYSTGENVGIGEGIFSGSTLGNLDFKSLSGSGGVSIFQSGSSTIVISSSIPVIPDPGEDNTASNVGAGTGLFAQKDGVDLEFKSLLVSGNLSIDSNASEISLSSSYATGENVGGGIEVFSGSTSGNFDFRTLSGSGGVSVTQTDDIVVISSSIPVIPDPGEDNTASNVGGGTGIFAQKDGVDLEFKSLLVSGNLTINSNASEVSLSSSYATGENTGSGQGVFLESINGNLLFRTIIGDGGTNISSGSNGVIVVSSALGGGSGEVNTAANIGSGEGLFSGKDGITINLRSLVGSGSTTILSGSDVVAISSSYATGENVGTGEGVFSGSSLGNLDFKSLSGSGGVSVFQEGANTIVISSSIPVIPDPGEDNTASNVGGGTGLFAQKDGVDLEFKSLLVSGNLAITSNASEVSLSSSYATGENTGSGQGVFLEGNNGNLLFRTLIGEGGTNISSGSNGVIVVSSALGGGSGEANTAANIGSGEGLFSGKDGITINLRSLVGSGSTTILSGSDVIAVSSSYATGENVGNGEGVFSGSSLGNLDFKSLSGSGGVSVFLDGANTIVISSSIPVIPDPGEDNTASNVGAGTGLFAQKDGVDLEFKSLLVSGNLSIDSNASEISLSSSYATGENVGGAIEIFSGSTNGNLDFRTLSGSGGTSVSQNGDLVVISSSIPVIPPPGEDNTASNIGVGEGIFAQKDGVDLEFKSLNVSGNLSITSNNAEINLSSSYATAESVGGGTSVVAGFSNGDIDLRSLLVSGNLAINSNIAEISLSSSYATAENVGGAIQIFSGSTNGNLDFRTLSGSGGTSVSQVDDVIIISSSVGGGSGEANTASNLGDGEGVFSVKDGIDLQFRSISGSGGISVVSGANNTIVISGSGGGTSEIWQMAIFEHRETTSAHGGTATAGVNTRPLNTTVLNEIDGASRTGSVITLPAGDYQSDSFQNVNGTLYFRPFLYEVGGGTVLVAGGTMYSDDSANPKHAHAAGFFTLTSSANIELRIEVSMTMADWGLGYGAGIGPHELFAQLRLWKRVEISGGFGGGSGEANTASNLGDGEGVFSVKNGIDLQFRSISGSGTITVLSGANNTIIISGSGGSGTGISSITFPNLRAFHIQDQKTAGTPGGTASVGWNDRPLTTVLRNEIAGASFTSGSYGVTIPSGTYIVSANAPTFKCDNHRLRFRSSTGVNFLLGPNSYNYSVENAQTHAFLHGQINVTASTTFFLQHYLQNPPADPNDIYAFGSDNSDGDIGTFADIIIYQQNTGSYTSGGGEEITASNLGDGEGVFSVKDGVDLQFRSISGSGGVSVLSGANNTIVISSSVGGGNGETNTASNLGDGEGVFSVKDGVDLQFRSISGSGGISVVSGANNTVVVSSSLPDVLSEVSGARSTASNLNDRISLISNFASPNAGGIIDGVYYSNSFHGSGTTTRAGAAGRFELAPFFSSHTMRINEIGVQVSTAVASSLIKILIYDSGADGWPNNKLFESGVIDTGTTNWRPFTGSTDFTFHPGIGYWIGWWLSSTATLRVVGVASAVNLGRSLTAPTTATTQLTISRRSFAWDAALDSAPNPYGIHLASYLIANAGPPSINFRATSSA